MKKPKLNYRFLIILAWLCVLIKYVYTNIKHHQFVLKNSENETIKKTFMINENKY